MELASRINFASARSRELAPGVLACGVVGAASAFLSEHYGAPVMLFALLLGMAMNFLSADGACRPGIEFSARQLLRIGIALLGLRITASQVVALGWGPVGMVVFSVVVTILASMAAARLVGFKTSFGVLTGGATAICGASAALALSAALPAHPLKDRATLFTVIGVSALSTLAMVLYPMITNALGMPAQQAGMFLGATIHDVAQVVGAGYSLSTQAGDTATLVKLMRVAMLLPVILAATLLTRGAGAAVALVRGGLRAAGGRQQHGLGPQGAEHRRQRHLALVPGRRHRRHRHEDAPEGTRHRGPQARGTHGGRNRLSRPADAGASAPAARHGMTMRTLT
jgi:uncharacterized integral membrane protein (TIGR00698 family)